MINSYQETTGETPEMEILDLQDGSKGLEVMVRDGKSIRVVPIPGTVYDLGHNNVLDHYTAEKTPEAITVSCEHGCYKAPPETEQI